MSLSILEHIKIMKDVRGIEPKMTLYRNLKTEDKESNYLNVIFGSKQNIDQLDNIYFAILGGNPKQYVNDPSSYAVDVLDVSGDTFKGSVNISSFIKYFVPTNLDSYLLSCPLSGRVYLPLNQLINLRLALSSIEVSTIAQYEETYINMPAYDSKWCQALFNEILIVEYDQTVKIW